MFFSFGLHWDMFIVRTVDRVNEPLANACCSLLEQLQQAVKNTGTHPRPAHPPISRVPVENDPFSFCFFSVELYITALSKSDQGYVSHEWKCCNKS